MGFAQEWVFRDCPWCGLRDAQMNPRTANMEAPRLSQASRWWSVLSCPRCGGAILLEHDAPNVPQSHLHLSVPDHGADVRIEHLPDDVKAYYSDAIRVLEAGVPEAAAVQLRRTLEAAAAHHGIEKGPLVQRIRGLIAQGLITKDFSLVMQHIREVGNVGAHATDTRVDEETARRALRFTTQVLRNLFEIPAELAALAGETPKQDGDEEQEAST